MNRATVLGNLQANLVVLLWLLAAVLMRNWVHSHAPREDAKVSLAASAKGIGE